MHVQQTGNLPTGRAEPVPTGYRNRGHRATAQVAGSRRAREPESKGAREMDRTYNGMPATELPDVTWKKSGRSNPSGNCVEMATLPGGAGIAVRNSRYPDGPALIYTPAEIAAFIQGARDGDFDAFVEH